MESIRVIMLRNWHFDILNLEHWNIAWDLWLNSWVISEPKEWAFVLIIISFIPLWFTGWIALSLISWGKLVWFILTLPWKLFKNFFYKPVKIITTNTGVTPIKRKKILQGNTSSGRTGDRQRTQRASRRRRFQFRRLRQVWSHRK